MAVEQPKHMSYEEKVAQAENEAAAQAEEIYNQ